MRTRRSDGAVPGFPASQRPPGTKAQPKKPARPAHQPDERIYPRAPRGQVGFRISVDTLERYSRLLIDLHGDRLDTNMNEVAQALLYLGPRTPDEVRDLIRQWRQIRDADL